MGGIFCYYIQNESYQIIRSVDFAFWRMKNDENEKPVRYTVCKESGNVSTSTTGFPAKY